MERYLNTPGEGSADGSPRERDGSAVGSRATLDPTASRKTGKPPAGSAPPRCPAPWDWQPSTSAWFNRFARLTDRWEPSADLKVQAHTVRRVILDATDAHEKWLRHPCVSAITFSRGEHRLQRDFQLVLWAAVHSPTPLGSVTVPEPLWAWCPGGGFSVPQGTHDLMTLGAHAASQDYPGVLALDAWARSMNVSFIQLWRDVESYDTRCQADLQRELKLFLRASAAAERWLAECFRWITAATQVAIPLRQTTGEHSNSSSSPQLPGSVFLTLQNELQIIEALVHETAHQHLFLAEAEGPLVDTGHAGSYHSPLRSDPRPLRGVLLAFHALAYIAAYYADALSHGLASAARLEQQLQTTRTQLREAEEVILSNRQYLTEIGRPFVDRTIEVGRYSA